MVLVDGLPGFPKLTVDRGRGAIGANDDCFVQAGKFHFLGHVQGMVENEAVRQFAANKHSFAIAMFVTLLDVEKPGSRSPGLLLRLPAFGQSGTAENDRAPGALRLLLLETGSADHNRMRPHFSVKPQDAVRWPSMSSTISWASSPDTVEYSGAVLIVRFGKFFFRMSATLTLKSVVLVK